jgi:aminocarboxymuconate-semialdehyde decarboxylase
MMMEPGSIVDVHAHLTPECFRAAVSDGGRWHGMAADEGELWNERNLWSVPRRLEEMDELGIDMQLVSPTIDFYQYHRNAAVTARIATETNDEIAGMVRDRPDRFMGLGTLPMQDVDRATAELARGMTELGLHGFEIGDHVDGRTYDDEIFDPVWEAAEELDAFLFVHQYRDTCVLTRMKDTTGPKATSGTYMLGNTIGNLVERVLTFSALIYGGVMDRYPDLNICLGHAGGYVSFAVDRMDKGWEARPQLRGKTQGPPSTYVRRFYYDSCTYQARTLRYLLDVVGADRVLFGTDWPAPMRVDDPVRMIQTMSELTAQERERILTGNAGELFGSTVEAAR